MQSLVIRQMIQVFFACWLLVRLVPARINTLITTLTVYEGEQVSLPCQVSGFPYPNETDWCRMPNVDGTCTGNYSEVTKWKTRWTEETLSTPIPSGILVLETDRINITDDKSQFVCFTSNIPHLTTVHKIDISIVSE